MNLKTHWKVEHNMTKLSVLIARLLVLLLQIPFWKLFYKISICAILCAYLLIYIKWNFYICCNTSFFMVAKEYSKACIWHEDRTNILFLLTEWMHCYMTWHGHNLCHSLFHIKHYNTCQTSRYEMICQMHLLGTTSQYRIMMDHSDGKKRSNKKRHQRSNK